MKVLVAPQSGSQAGTTASRNRYGQYLRTRAMPTQPRTSSQISVRGILTTLSQTWRTLTDANRAAWTAYAAGVALKDSLGQTYFQTGFQAYVGCGARLIQTQGFFNPGPPAAGSTFTPTTDLSFGSTSHSSLTVGFGYAEDTDDDIQIFTSPPVSVGVTFAPRMTQVVAIPNYASADQVPLAALLSGMYGTLSEGQKFIVRIDGSLNGVYLGSLAGAVVLT